MKEVGGHIEKQVAYLSGEALVQYFSVNHPFASFFGHPGFSFPCPGGRGEDSSVIITLPECSAFSDIPEEALAKVFTYLTLIPRCVLLLLCSAVRQKARHMHPEQRPERLLSSVSDVL